MSRRLMSLRPFSLSLLLVVCSTALGLQAPAAEGAPPTTTFVSTGAEQQYTVPAGASALIIHAVGAPGGCHTSSVQYGGDVTATVSVTGGQLIYVEVGGDSDVETGAGGFNGGGAAGNGESGGVGGGGASDVRTAPRTEDGSLGSRLVVAGGGGGGGDANSSCVNGSASAGVGGAGTVSAGGAGGTTTTGCEIGTAGSAGTGGKGGVGSGGSCPAGGGGGGGGLFGGGGGGPGETGGAGGPGSSGAPGDPEAMVTADTTGVAKVEITPVMAVASFVPTYLAFGAETIGTSAATKVTTVTNTGLAPLSITGIGYAGAHASEFTTSSSTCGLPVAVGASCAIGVAFAPKAAGSRRASLALASNIGDLTVALRGNGVTAQTATFVSAGEEQSYTVPAGVNVVVVHALGAAGACESGMNFQYGADVTATVPVTPGEVLYVEVGGGAGFDVVEGGWNGGGEGGDGGYPGSGGGGASDVRTSPRTTTGSLDTRLVVAGGGGGGGGGNQDCGQGSGTAGAGGNGTESAGGAAGTTTTGCSLATGGSAGQGGDGGIYEGDDCLAGGGGGGGGLFGGGGGGGGLYAGGAGGNGSSGAPADPSAVIVPNTTGAPVIEITPFVAAASFAPTSLAFGTETIGTSATTKLLTVTNSGLAPLSITGIGYAGPQATEFTTSSSTCGLAVAAGATCAIGVAFAPTATGTRAASLVLAGNLGDLTVALTGTSVSNRFSFVKLTRNTTKGTAKVVVAIPSPGRLKLSGPGVKTQRKTVTTARAGLSIVPKAGLRDKLARLGAVRLKVTVTFTPTGGDPRTKSKWVKVLLD